MFEKLENKIVEKIVSQIEAKAKEEGKDLLENTIEKAEAYLKENEAAIEAKIEEAVTSYVKTLFAKEATASTTEPTE